MNYKEQIKELLSDPIKLKQKKPFTRGADTNVESGHGGVHTVNIGDTMEANLPNYRRYVVSQEQFLKELDPRCHDVLFNENLPSICVKMKRGGFQEIKFERMAIAFQKLIKSIQLIYLTAHKMDFTMNETEPTDEQSKRFVKLKQMWKKRNQDGIRNKMVDTQMSCGDAGLLYYFDYKGQIKSRVLSYADGYVLCPHNDDNGDRILESVYYVKDDIEYIDSYDDKFMYRYKLITGNDKKAEWVLEKPVQHGFPEIPLITKRGDVPWNDVQSIIDSYEEQYNVFNAIQRRFGWGIFYIKGKFKDNGQKIAGNVVLNDTSLEGKGDAKFLTPPTPQNTIEYLKQLLSTIQLGSQTTFVLPEDIKMTGDVSGLAVQVTKELDIQHAMQNVIEWQNVADKMLRLFKFGLSVELVNNEDDKTAVTDFDNLNVTAQFKIWRPFNEYEFNQMLTTLTGAGILSRESGTELNTVAMPDEKSRVKKQVEEEERKAKEKQEEIFKRQQLKMQGNPGVVKEPNTNEEPKPKNKEDK